MILKFIPIFGILLSINMACTMKIKSENEDTDEDEIPEVEVIQLQKEELFDFMTFSTTLAAHSQVSVYSPLSGHIRKLSVQEGSKVSKTLLILISMFTRGFLLR